MLANWALILGMFKCWVLILDLLGFDFRLGFMLFWIGLGFGLVWLGFRIKAGLGLVGLLNGDWVA